ncbi:MAG: dienelactone hydrolase family protein [Proteobacteria bacterium]|nr:dienelactone hydrolase family protein [Pseudomonadota bacterium]
MNAQPRTEFSFSADPRTLEARANWLAPHLHVTKPEGEGRFPVVLMLHGCGGPRPFLRDIAAVAVEAGAAAVLVDSFAPRAINRAAAYATVCTGARLRGRERAGDLYAAIAWARQQNWADATRIVAAGWSHGAWTIMDALSLRVGEEMRRATGLTDLNGEPLVGLTSTFLAYPYAGPTSFAGRRAWRMAPRSVAVTAGRDMVVGYTRPRAALSRLRDSGAPIEIVHFENATHAFEDADTGDLLVRFDPQATAREHALLSELIGAC